MDGIASTWSLARRVLCLLPPLRDWFAEVDGLASDARTWRAVRTALQAEKIIAATQHVIADQQQAEIIDFLSYLTPCRSRRFGKIRLGRNGDGGYVLLDDFTARVDASTEQKILERPLSIEELFAPGTLGLVG